MIDWSDYPNFTEAEMRCKCGCGRADMKPSFMMTLQRMRNAYGMPMVVTSGFRCPDYNDRVSKTGRNGPHTTGRAADIKVSGENVYHMMGRAYAVDVRGIGLKQHGAHASRFMHVDDLGGPVRPRVWTYT